MNLDIECAISKLPKYKLIEVGEAVLLHDNFVSIDYFGVNSILAINKMLPDDSVVNQLINDTYYCYYTSNHMNASFYRAVPTYILTNDVGKYFDQFQDNSHIQHFRDMACDADWFVPDWDDIPPNRVQSTLLGSGYYTDTYNGSASVHQLAVELDNGDHLICHFNCFYHK